MQFFTTILNTCGAMVLWVVRMLAGVMEEIFHGIGRGLGQMMAQLMPWIIGAAVVLGVIKFMPEIVGPLFGIAVCIIALRVMVRGFFPGGRNNNNRRH